MSLHPGADVWQVSDFTAALHTTHRTLSSLTASDNTEISHCRTWVIFLKNQIQISNILKQNQRVGRICQTCWVRSHWFPPISPISYEICFQSYACKLTWLPTYHYVAEEGAIGGRKCWEIVIFWVKLMHLLYITHNTWEKCLEIFFPQEDRMTKRKGTAAWTRRPRDHMACLCFIGLPSKENMIAIIIIVSQNYKNKYWNTEKGYKCLLKL